MAKGKSWREVRGELALNETRMDTHRRVMDAQLRIAESLLARGAVSEERVDEALAASQPEESAAGQEDTIYLSSLARYVTALDGRLELRAVFSDVTVTLPGPGAADGDRSGMPRP